MYRKGGSFSVLFYGKHMAVTLSLQIYVKQLPYSRLNLITYEQHSLIQIKLQLCPP